MAIRCAFRIERSSPNRTISASQSIIFASISVLSSSVNSRRRAGSRTSVTVVVVAVVVVVGVGVGIGISAGDVVVDVVVDVAVAVGAGVVAGVVTITVVVGEVKFTGALALFLLFCFPAPTEGGI